MSICRTLNCEDAKEAVLPVQGMIDAAAYHHSLVTWPAPFKHVRINSSGEEEPFHVIDSDAAMKKMAYVDGVDISEMTTVGIGGLLVKLNSRAYNEMNANNSNFVRDFHELSRVMDEIRKLLSGRERGDLGGSEKKELEVLDEKESCLRKRMSDVYRRDIPSLVVASTADMEFAHTDGYDGKNVYCENEVTHDIYYKRYGLSDTEYLKDDYALMFQDWARQVSDMEASAAANPLRLFPLFFYDPRRYRLPLPDDGAYSDLEREDIQKNCSDWREPFARIAGHGDS